MFYFFDIFGPGFVLWIILFYWLYRMNGRIRRLEERSNGQPVAPQSASVQGPAPAALPGGDIPQSVPEPAYVVQQQSGFDVVAWFKEDWLLKLGALLLLFGFGWFVTYAFLNNWIGPVGRITLGIVAGVGILLLGWWRIQTYLRQEIGRASCRERV